MFETLNSKEFKVINKSIKKVDGRGLVRGKPVYAGDLDIPNALHVKLVRSPHAHAINKENR